SICLHVLIIVLLFFIMMLLALLSTLFPYTTLFRSGRRSSDRAERCFGGGLPFRREFRARVAHAHRGRRGPDRLPARSPPSRERRSEEHTSELQSLAYLVCRLLLEKKKMITSCSFTK